MLRVTNSDISKSVTIYQFTLNGFLNFMVLSYFALVVLLPTISGHTLFIVMSLSTTILALSLIRIEERTACIIDKNLTAILDVMLACELCTIPVVLKKG